MAKTITAINGSSIIVDDDDHAALSQFKWSISKAKGYAFTFCRYKMDGEIRYCPHSIHAMLMRAPKGKHVDHINGDPLDNQKENLRFVTPAQNNINVHHPAQNKTGYPGVFIKETPSGKIKYRAKLEISGTVVNLGYFKTPEEAGAAYLAAKEKRKEELFKK